ncbi:Alpha-tubulin N-acetyltransferase 1, partial [Mortierella sp. NVP85]
KLAQNPTQRVYVVRTRLDGGEDHWLDQLDIGSPLMEESIQKSRLELSGAGTISTSVLTQEESKNGTRARSEEKGVYVAGMLKMGEKKLFIVDKSGTMHEQEACCVLDFYVDESYQRQGFGKLLFDYMLKVEQMDPTQIAYDRPSPKLFGFLNKHFQLNRHLPQPNLFAIFEGFKLLDCGQVIQVDDNALSPAGRSLTHASSLIPAGSSSTDSNHTGNIHGTKPVVINRALQSSLVFGSGPEPSSPGTKPVVVNRALQSSLVFGSGIELDSAGTSSSYTSSSRPQPPQPVKRVSSAFSSSFSLSNDTPTTPRTGTATSAGISRLLASSIVFADP